MLAILLRERLIAPRWLISTLQIPELGGGPAGTSTLRIGGATTLRQIEQSKVVTDSWPVLAEAAHVIGNVRVRTVGTVGGQARPSWRRQRTFPSVRKAHLPKLAER